MYYSWDLRSFLNSRSVTTCLSQLSFKSKNSCLLLFWQLKQAQPLGHPVGCDAMPLSQLFPGQIIADQFILQLHGNDQRVTKSLSGNYDRKVRTPESKDVRRFFNGSTVVTLGVPH